MTPVRLLTLTAALLPGLSLLAGPVVINEIHYAPSDKTVEEEFVELHNCGPTPVDVSGWYFSAGISFEMPAGTTIEPAGYLVVAQNPAVLTAIHGPLPVVGPFTGRLDNQGESLVLRNRDGGREDEVDYRRGFPWPTAGGSAGYSIELTRPELDNDLGGSWRISNPEIGESSELIRTGDSWRYFKGTGEASSPVTAWRAGGFDDSGWDAGAASIGYGEGFVSTLLDDMRGNYSTVYLRKTFDVKDAAAIGSLILEVQYDDGFNAWINGRHVAGDNVPSTEMAFNGTALSALENHDLVDFALPRPPDYLVTGTNVLALQLHNASLDGSSDAFVDARLVASAGAGAGPTPGAMNSVFTTNSPPHMRQVNHDPPLPATSDPVLVTVKVTDDEGLVESVVLEYQVVEPGAYIALDDAAYDSGWTAVEMNDDGEGGDGVPGDDTYSVLVEAGVQAHRRLVRYRITATDVRGNEVRAPYPDDPQPNFAYFVHDGVPAWRGASRPGVTPVEEFSAEVMSSLPVYHLIASEADVVNSQYVGSFDGVHFLGTLVYDGVVYDHIEFENRGEFSTYVSGKNKWRFHFNRGHSFQARDDYGNEYRAKWKTMNLSAAATPWVPTNRGMAALDESVAFKLYSLAGSLSPNTNLLQLRVIDEAAEAHPTDQYRGDLWGLYMTIEHTDGRMLDERGLADGNTYKIESGGGDKRNQGATQPTDSSDYNALRNGYNSSQPLSWWRSNVDLAGYYSFRAINRAINNMDLREGWNVCQYHNPETDLWTVIPWDLDMLYMPLTHWSGVMNFQNALSQHSLLLTEYENRARELQDLLFTADQFGQLVEELAAIANPAGEPLTMVDVDEAMWNDHPRTAGSHRGMFYRNPSNHSARGGTITRTLVSADHEGMARWIQDFALSGYGSSRLASHAADGAIPEQPTITSIGAAGFPIDDLRLRSSAFVDPQGNGTFGAMRWRLGEVTRPGLPGFDPIRPRPYEIVPVWESGDMDVFTSDITIPPHVVAVGRTYRARVRMMDTSARWSRWSEPVEFTAGESSAPLPEQSYLRITELMYHPAEGRDHEFVEILNTGPAPLDLTHVSFTEGIRFDFATGDVTTLAPGEHVVVVEDRRVFGNRYDTTSMRIAGEYSGRLSNLGERITLRFGAGVTVLDFAYADDWYPPTDGGGFSLVHIDPYLPASDWGLATSWRSSKAPGGSPGVSEGPPPPGGVQRPGDSNQDGVVDLADAVSLLVRLFRGGALPCDGDSLQEGGNRLLLDVNLDAGVNVSDVVFLLNYLVRRGPPLLNGTSCARLEGCPDVCSF